MNIPAIWHDHLNLLAKLTPLRIWNRILLEISYHLSNLLRRPLVWGYPSSFSLEPTNRCNLRCPECPVGAGTMKRNSGFIKAEVFQKAVNKMSPYALYLLLYFQGEPFLHGGIFDMIREARKQKLYIAISTNAHFLNMESARQTVNSGLDKLIISLDGTDQETYSAYRVGGDLEIVLDGIRNIISAKDELKSRTPFVEVQFLVLGTNEHQIPEIKRLASDLKVDKLLLKTAQIYNYEEGSPLIPDNPRYSRYRQLSSGKYEIKMKMRNRCYRMWTSCVITFEGDVIPCCFDKDANYKMGNIAEENFPKIWKSKAYMNFRHHILNGRRNIPMCRNCTEGLKRI